MKRAFRFRLRTLLLAFVIVAIVLGVVPQAYNWWRWQSIESEIRVYLQKEIEDEIPTHIRVDNDYPLLGFSIAIPFRIDIQHGNSTIYELDAPSKQEGDLMYVVPPGRWVKSIDEALDEFERKYYQSYGWRWQ